MRFGRFLSGTRSVVNGSLELELMSIFNSGRSPTPDFGYSTLHVSVLGRGVAWVTSDDPSAIGEISVPFEDVGIRVAD